MKSYCVKQKKNRLNASSQVVRRLQKMEENTFGAHAQNVELKNKIYQKQGKLSQPSHGGGILDTAASTGANLFLQHGIPWVGKKAVEMGRYYGSEALRNPKIQKKALDFALDQLSPMTHNVGAQALEDLSTKIRPQKNYKTNRKDLDGGGVDIHKMIGKLPKPKGGFTLPGHKYTGPYNDLDSQVRFDPVTVKILDQPSGKTDAVALQHDVDYSVCKDDRKCKNMADRKMVKALDNIPWKERQWGDWLARNAINTKQKLGLGVSKNGRR